MNYLPQFIPARWLKNPHLQTIWAEVMRKRIALKLSYEQFELSCGDFVELAWSQKGKNQTVLILPGLGGSSTSSYVRGMTDALNRFGFNTVIMHFRGSSKEPNRFPEFYHGGQTCDLAEVIMHLKKRAPHEPIFAVGFSVGGNILLKYLGECGKTSGLACAIAISVPFLLDKTQAKLSKGLSRVYQHYLLVKLKLCVIKKILLGRALDLNPWLVCVAKDIKDFDEIVTAPLHGFKNALDYYIRSSSLRYLKSIQTDTLVIHAKDDPFIPEDALPTEDNLSPSIEFLLTEQGGHVGFVAGESLNSPIYWLEEVVPFYLLSKIKHHRR